MRLGSSISAFGRSCLVLHLIDFLLAPLSLNLIRSNLGLQPHFGFFFMSSSLALVTPASLDAACLRVTRVLFLVLGSASDGVLVAWSVLARMLRT